MCFHQFYLIFNSYQFLSNLTSGNTLLSTLTNTHAIDAATVFAEFDYSLHFTHFLSYTIMMLTVLLIGLKIMVGYI